MSSQSFAAEQLLELLLQLKKTTPTAARSILNAQPQIAYALMTLMVSMNAVNFDVFQKILADYGTNNKPVAPAPAPAAPTPSIAPSIAPSTHPSTSSTPVPALPPHLQYPQYRTATPPSQPYGAYPNGQGAPPPQVLHQPYAQTQYPPQQAPPVNPSYGYSQPQPGYGYPAPGPAYSAAPSGAGILPDTLASIPDDQKALIMRVITMTPEQIHALPPAERQTYIQLRATLGVPT
ncbi:hypothetical protein Hypma_010956 [Hypsizygus marmoreus]|uniref:Cleavage stimulation factor subunit 2 hinge domain-containing protein n=1 Tax=Hypsizygus marmoreus TaxID=39966 RepID=A0A369JQK3_HYPMA|nr:hypothetical protein Hypma_010956 [Hypsizygus marmoreus]